MLKLITRLLSNDSKSQPSTEESFIHFAVEGRVNEKLLPNLLSWILGISITAGGLYGVSTVLPSANSEVLNNDSNQIESLDRVPN